MNPYLLLLVGFAALGGGAEALVRGAASLARRYRVSDLAIGLTVVAFGTSAPELFVTSVAGLRGSAGIALGNVVGSTVANILLVLGVSSIIAPLRLTRATVWREIPMSLGAAIVLFLLAGGVGGGVVSRGESLFLLAVFALFLCYSFAVAGRSGLEEEVPALHRGPALSLLLVAAGIAGLSYGAGWIVEGAVEVSRRHGLSEAFTGLTVVAVGTSLPELAVSTVAALRGKVDMAVGNVLGSNIFNVFFVLGVSSLLRPLPVAPGAAADLAVMIGANALLFVFMFLGRRHTLRRAEGATFLALYAAYLAYLVARG